MVATSLKLTVSRMGQQRMMLIGNGSFYNWHTGEELELLSMLFVSRTGKDQSHPFKSR